MRISDEQKGASHLKRFPISLKWSQAQKKNPALSKENLDLLM